VRLTERHYSAPPPRAAANADLRRRTPAGRAVAPRAATIGAASGPGAGDGLVSAASGAVLRDAGRSLLPVGVTRVDGDFGRGDLVVCLGPDGEEVARGLVNYSAEESRRIIGQPSSRIESLLGYVDEPELIHRDNLVLV